MKKVLKTKIENAYPHTGTIARISRIFCSFINIIAWSINTLADIACRVSSSLNVTPEILKITLIASAILIHAAVG